MKMKVDNNKCQVTYYFFCLYDLIKPSLMLKQLSKIEKF